MEVWEILDSSDRRHHRLNFLTVFFLLSWLSKVFALNR